MQKEQKRSYIIKIIIAVVLVGIVAILWAGCSSRAKENNLSTTQQAYVDYQNSKMDVYAEMNPNETIDGYVVFSKSLTESEMLSIVDQPDLHPAGLRFFVGEGQGGFGFDPKYLTWQGGMNEFWNAEIKRTMESLETTKKVCQDVQNDPDYTEEMQKSWCDAVDREEKQLEKAKNHDYTFAAAGVYTKANSARKLRDQNKEKVLFIDIQKIGQ